MAHLPVPPRLRLPSPVQGLLIALAPERYPTWLLRHYEGGTMAEFRVPGLGRVVSVIDPEAFRELARSTPAGAANARVLAVLGERSVLHLDGEEHLRMRRLLSPAFHGEAIARHRAVVVEATRAEVATWAPGTTIRLLPRMQHITREVILRAVLGTQDAQLRALLPRVLSVNPFLVMAEGRLPALGRVRALAWVRARQDVLRRLEHEIARRRAAGEHGDDVLGVLLAEDELTDADLRDQLFALLLAGHDTTATTLAWCFERLLRHPDALVRARADDAFLTACIDETLRVRPALDVAWRTVDRDLEAGGHTLRAGTLVMLGIRATHRLPTLYADAAAWDPDRERPVMVPFGGGPRRCLGAGFAQMELHAVLRTVLDAVDLAPASRRDERQSRTRTITTVPSRGARARVLGRRLNATAPGQEDPGVVEKIGTMSHLRQRAGRVKRAGARALRDRLPDDRPLREQFGLTQLQPVSREFGFERGKPIDRFYIERFLDAHRTDVAGRVLEVAEPTYTEWFGDGRVTQSDVLHRTGAPGATVVGDLQTGEGIPADAFDCFVCTQTLQFIEDLDAAVRGVRDALTPGGVALVTLPGVSQTSREDRRDWGDWRRFTRQGAARTFERAGFSSVEAVSHGNVLVCAAFLYGFAAEELTSAELAFEDSEYELLVTVRAVR